MIVTLIAIFILLIAYRIYRVILYRSEFVIRCAQEAVKVEDTINLIKGAFDELDRVSCHKMFWKFWIPFDGFFNGDNKDTK